MSDQPVDFKKIFANRSVSFERPPEALVKQCEEQIKAGRKQYLAASNGRSRIDADANESLADPVWPDAEQYLTDPEEQGDE